MKKERLISILILVLTMSICFSACTGGGPADSTVSTDASEGSSSDSIPEDESSESASSSSSSSPSSDITDTSSESPDDTSVPETTVQVPGGGTILTPEDLKLDPVFFSYDVGNIVEITESEGNYLVKARKTGQDKVTFYNCYGESAEADITVTTDKIDCIVTPFVAPQVTFNVLENGAKANNAFDCTKAIQECINKASEAGGGTVYLPAGKYRVGSLSMKPGVSLRLEGFLPDATVGYTVATKAYAESGKLAIISSTGASTMNIFFYNVDLPQSYCTTGTSDFLISGGMLDCKGKMKAAGFCCGKNITFENCIIKDIPNNHAFQIEGCTNVTIRNVMFAGYNFPNSGGILTRETIQLEPTSPGAIGSNPDTNPIQCNDGDYYSNYNVSVIGCYFGPSDKYGSHLTAVGHHSTTGGLACDGFLFTGNVVDNPLYCGLHMLNTINVTITDNKFISTRRTTSEAIDTDSALISLYGSTSSSSYTDQSGKKVYYCYNYELPGNKNYTIKNNTFTIGGKTHLRAVYIAGIKSEWNMSAIYKKSSSEYRIAEYGSKPFNINGYVLQHNTAYDIKLYNNTFNIISAITKNDCFAYFSNVRGLTFDDNEINNSGDVKFTRSHNNTAGLSVNNATYGDEMYKRIVSFSKSAKATVTLVCGDTKTVLENPANDVTMIFKSKGHGSIEFETDVYGNLSLILTSDEGYVFTGWENNSGKPFDLTKKLTASSTIFAIFSPQN